MAFLDRKASVTSGHSRASSGRSRGAPQNISSSGGDMFSAAASGVLSMLKTSTDSGDIGDLSFNTRTLPSMPRPAHRRRNNVARLSASSQHSTHSYTPSQVSKRNSNSQAWDAVSAISQATHTTHGRHRKQGSQTSLQTMQTLPSRVSDTRSPPRQGTLTTSAYESRLIAPFSPDGRSYSLTQPQPSLGLKPHRSATSLRSQGSGPYPPQRNPYAYPARLRRPGGYRAPSPVLSDLGGPQYSAYGLSTSINDGGPYGFTYDRPSGDLYNQPYSSSQRQSHGAFQRPIDGSFSQQQDSHYGRTSRRPLIPTSNSDYASGAPPFPRHVRNAMHASRPGHQNVAHLTIDQSQYNPRLEQKREGPPFPMPVHGTTYLPPRLYTPQTNSIPSSSEQGSSAPPSSNPPTPKDSTTIQVTLDPVFVDPAFSDIPDEQTEPHDFPNYLKYAEKAGQIYELDTAEPAAAELAAAPTPSRGGFVKRIKSLLEDRIQARPLSPRSSVSQQSHALAPPLELAVDTAVETHVQQQPLELPTIRTPNEELVQLPEIKASIEELVELPAGRASISKPVEMEAPTRLTRDLIKANTAPSSSDQNTSTSQPSQPADDTNSTLEKILPAGVLHDETGNGDVTGMIDSSPPHPILGPVSADTTSVSDDLLEDGDTDFAIEIQIPVRIHSDVTARLRPATTDIDPQQAQGPLSGPVSPLRPDDECVRDSLVSPMATRTLQISAEFEQKKVPGSFPEEKLDPPSPMLRPLSGHLSGNVSSNRFSLPPDLSILNDQDATSEVVTDIAVRLSVPRKVEQGKPQLVSVNTAAEATTSQAVVTNKQASDSRSLRESFFNIEKIAPPLMKKPDSLPAPQIVTNSTDLSSFIRRSFPRRQSAWPGDRTDTRQASVESTAEIRFPGMKSCPGHLPGLKEDSQEDMSIKNYRSSPSRSRLPLFQPLPTDLHGNHLSEDSNRLNETAKLNHLPYVAPRMTLAELRNIPSLNFSRLDLVDKLNEALESRSSKSFELVRRRNFSGIHCPSPLRPSSTEALRERYTSFFAKPEEFQVPEPVPGDTTDEEVLNTATVKEDAESTRADSSDLLAHYANEVVSPQVDRPISPPEIRTASSLVRTQSPSIWPSSRPLSPEQLLNLADDANRLSVPSVAALSERLSEWLPSIKHLLLDSVIADDKAVRDTIEEIHHLGLRPDSEGFARSSTGLFQMAAMADDIVTNGTHDSAALDARMLKLIKELPPLPEDTERFSLSESGLDRNTVTMSTETLSSLIVADPEATKPALLRVKSLNDIEDPDQLHPGYSTSATKRSLGPSTHHSRPWNLDEYYPWNSDTVKIDIEFPKPILRRNTSASTVLRRSKVSDDDKGESDEAGDTRRPTRARSPLSDPPTMFFEASPTIDSTINSRKTSKRSLIGSLSRRIGLGGHKAKLGLNASIMPVLSTPPGDRYPSTALIPPSALNMDEVRSFFSDSTSNGSEKRKSFRKHINIFRSRIPGGPATLSASHIHSLDAERNRSLENHGQESQNTRSISLYDHRFTGTKNLQTYEGMVGMGKVEFRVKRVTERLRLVLLRTGQMIRTLSHKRDPAARRLQKERERAEWLDDSVYSGT